VSGKGLQGARGNGERHFPREHGDSTGSLSEREGRQESIGRDMVTGTYGEIERTVRCQRKRKEGRAELHGRTEKTPRRCTRSLGLSARKKPQDAIQGGGGNVRGSNLPLKA